MVPSIQQVVVPPQPSLHERVPNWQPEAGFLGVQQDLQLEYLVTPFHVQDEAPAALPQSQDLYLDGHLQLLYLPPQAVPTPCKGEAHFCKSPRQTHLSK